MSAPGPAAFGRGVVILPGQDVPEPWRGAERVVVGEAEVDGSAPTLATLHRAWFGRRPVVVELATRPEALRSPEVCRRPVHELDPGFEFARERLQFLVWANNYDARSGEPVWWHGRRAARRLSASGLSGGGPADVVTGDGVPLYIDGGPFAPPEFGDGTGVVHRWDAEAGRGQPVGSDLRCADLAPDQLAAVRHSPGGARVIAPAGSGKTRVLTERLRHLVADQGVHAGTVTALAYNTRAAEELRQRSGDFLNPDGPHIRTLNSLGLWICNEFGGGGRLATLEELQVRALLGRTFDVRRQANTDTVAPYLDALSAIRLGLRAPMAVEAAIPDAVGIATGFDRYRQALTDARALDFDEQIYRAIEILLTDPDARTAVQASCRHLLVDEFQDLNPAHLLLLRLISAPTYECFGVGDDDQVIYDYAGATPEYLIDFSRYFPGAGDHALEVNYRCPPAVVRAASQLLSYNSRRVDKRTRTPPDRPDGVGPFAGPLDGLGPVGVLRRPAERLAATATEVVASWRAGGVAPEGIAVLARVNSALLPVQIAFIEAGIPCTAPLGVRVLERTGMRTALAYLRIALDPERIDREDVLQTIRRPSRGIAPAVADMLTRRPTSSISDIRRLAGRLSGGDVPKLRVYADALDAVRGAAAHSSADVLRAVRVDIGLGATMDVLDGSRGGADRSTHIDDLLALESVATLHPDVATFEPWLRGLLGRGPVDDGGVLLSTIHKIKGREWDHVVVFGATDGLLPHRLSDDEEAERRVFHVAITRGRRQVVILADAGSPSPFVAELDGARPRGPLGPARPARVPDGGGRRPGAGRPGSKKRAKTQPAVRTVEAAVGLEIEHAGQRGTIVELGEGAAVLAVGSVRLRVPYGSDVSMEGTRATLVTADGRGAASSQAASAAEAALREWRSDAARRAKVPAYVVLNDRELFGIAVRRPASLAELAACPGMGPVRMERWGDEIIATLSEG